MVKKQNASTTLKYWVAIVGAHSKNGTKHLLIHSKRYLQKPPSDIRQSILV